MECQSVARLRAAPASVAAADISALLPESVGQGSLVTEDQREVCRLSPWGDVAGKRNPYPTDYRSAFALSLVLYPLPRRLALRFAFPDRLSGWGDNGLTTFRRCTRVGKVAFVRRWHSICAGGVRS